MIESWQAQYVFSEVMGIIRFNEQYRPTMDEWQHIANQFGNSDRPITFEHMYDYLVAYRLRSS